MELPRIASHTSISPTNIELLNYHHNVSSSGSGDDTELLLVKPARGTAASRKPLSACITDYGGSSSGGGAGAVVGAGAAASGAGANAGAATAAVGAGGAPAAAGAAITFTAPTFSIIPGVGAAFQPPSRRREEACALQNLKRRVQQLRLMKANQQEPIEYNMNAREREDLDNRPHLFQKIITNRPVSMVLDSAELRTAWQDSDFITDCLCWHNVYRQRHMAPPLTMSTQPISDHQFDDNMFKTLTCRHCKFYLNVSPIMAFDDGTSICGRCYKEEDFTDDTRPVRNKLYESISQYVPFPCKYRDIGCTKRRPGNALAVHEGLCLFRPSTCPVSDCDWNGIVQSLQEHYKSNHPDLYVENRVVTLDTNRDYEENKFVIDNEIQFIVQVKCETSSGKLWCAAICINSAACNASYNLELEFVYSEGRTSLVFKTPVSTSIQPMNQDESLQFDVNLLKKLLNTAEDLTANIIFTLAERKNILVEPTLLKEFECPVCNHYMVSSVYICKNGHSLCHFCKTQINTCPICRVPLTGVHNYALESIIEQMNYPCQYHRNGCRFISPAGEIQAHEINCALQMDTPQAVENAVSVVVPATP